MKSITRFAVLATLALAVPSWPQEPLDPEPPAASLSSKARIAPADEPGDPLVISGQVFDPAGLHPVGNIVVLQFEGDRKVTQELAERSRRAGRFGGVRPLTRGADGTWALHVRYATAPDAVKSRGLILRPSAISVIPVPG